MWQSLNMNMTNITLTSQSQERLGPENYFFFFNNKRHKVLTIGVLNFLRAQF